MNNKYYSFSRYSIFIHTNIQIGRFVLLRFMNLTKNCHLLKYYNIIPKTHNDKKTWLYIILFIWIMHKLSSNSIRKKLIIKKKYYKRLSPYIQFTTVWELFIYPRYFLTFYGIHDLSLSPRHNIIGYYFIYFFRFFLGLLCQVFGNAFHPNKKSLKNRSPVVEISRGN